MAIIRLFILMMLLVFSVTSAVAYPLRAYGPWRIDCLEKNNQTLTLPSGEYRNVSSSETWSVELQNARSMEKSSVRCWCKSDRRYEWDTEELGVGNGFWTFVKHLNDEGESCTCDKGAVPLVEMDPHTCAGSETAHGFFRCSGAGCTSSASSLHVGFYGVIGLVATVVGTLF